MKVLCFTLLILIGVDDCQSTDLLYTLEKALLNNHDASNLILLRRLFYPSQSIPTSTIYIYLKTDEFNVTTIKNSTCCSHHGCRGSSCRPAFVYSENDDEYKLNTSQNKLSFYLSDSSNSNSYSKLKNFILSRNVTSYMILNEYVSYLVFNALTFTKLTQNEELKASIRISIKELNEMPSYAHAIGSLMSLLSWVSFFLVL